MCWIVVAVTALITYVELKSSPAATVSVFVVSSYHPAAAELVIVMAPLAPFNLDLHVAVMEFADKRIHRFLNVPATLIRVLALASVVFAVLRSPIIGL